jgi:hypothetical protein
MVAARHNMRAGELAGVNRGLMLIDPDFGFCKTFTRPGASRRAAAVDSARIMVGISQMGVLEAFTRSPGRAAIRDQARGNCRSRARQSISTNGQRLLACDRREWA